MSDLVVFTYQHPDHAAVVLKNISSLQRESIREPSALLLLVKDTPIATLAETLNAQGGRLHHTTLSDEAAAVFTQAAERPEIEELRRQILG